MDCQTKKNKDISKIEVKQQKLEDIMLKEQGKGKNKDGRTAKANKALKQYEKNSNKISFIQFKRKC